METSETGSGELIVIHWTHWTLLYYTVTHRGEGEEIISFTHNNKSHCTSLGLPESKILANWSLTTHSRDE